MKKIIRRKILFIGLLALFCASATLILLSRTKIETTDSGVHTKLVIPILGDGSVVLPIYTGSGETVTIPNFLDGPIVRKKGDGSWSAEWFCEDSAKNSQGRGSILNIECAGRMYSFDLQPTRIPAAVLPMPKQVIVLSDLEGNIAFLDKALRKLEVVDAMGNWRYGQGQLVILGDSVDRGRDVFAVLWRLHALSAQANSAGGALHVVLGNHEQYMLGTNPSKANAEHLYALNTMGGYESAFSNDTVIGQWLRQQPVMLKMCSVLFAHGGVGPDVAESGLSVEQINNASKDYWNSQSSSHVRNLPMDAALGRTGVTQYRGYFTGVDGLYSVATDTDVQLALSHFDASQIVVAHTIVDKVKEIRGGFVYAVDVNSNDSLPEVLTYQDGLAKVLNIGIPRNIDASPATTLQNFRLSNNAHRQLLFDMYKDLNRLSALPYPY